MIRVLEVEGMACGHCSARVQKVLEELNGVEKAEVDLAAKTAQVTLTQEVADDVLIQAVTQAGYEVTAVR